MHVFVNLWCFLLMRSDGLMSQDLADFLLLPEFNSSDRNLTFSQDKNLDPGFYKDNTVHGKYVLNSDVWLDTTPGIKTWSYLTEWLSECFYSLCAFLASETLFSNCTL